MCNNSPWLYQETEWIAWKFMVNQAPGIQSQKLQEIKKEVL